VEGRKNRNRYNRGGSIIFANDNKMMSRNVAPARKDKGIYLGEKLMV
jgi:hypothetical protein